VPPLRDVLSELESSLPPPPRMLVEEEEAAKGRARRRMEEASFIVVSCEDWREEERPCYQVLEDVIYGRKI
jgi:hypothetical protein